MGSCNITNYIQQSEEISYLIQSSFATMLSLERLRLFKKSKSYKDSCLETEKVLSLHQSHVLSINDAVNLQKGLVENLLPKNWCIMSICLIEETSSLLLNRITNLSVGGINAVISLDKNCLNKVNEFCKIIDHAEKSTTISNYCNLSSASPYKHVTKISVIGERWEE